MSNPSPTWVESSKLNVNIFQAIDPGMEWTQSLVKFLKEQLGELSKLIANYAPNMNSNSSIPGN